MGVRINMRRPTDVFGEWAAIGKDVGMEESHAIAVEEMISFALKERLNIGKNFSFLDIGCGPGGMVQLAEQHKLKALGIDGDHTVTRHDPTSFLIHDFTTGPAPITGLYDIGWCVEFVEHVYEK